MRHWLSRRMRVTLAKCDINWRFGRDTARLPTRTRPFAYKDMGKVCGNSEDFEGACC